jgi:tRNA (mo5U34)-methyltransferase
VHNAPPDAEAAHRFLAQSDCVWFQRFELGGGVYTPGTNDLEWVFATAGVPDDLSGKSALDIGTSNGGAAFELERRGAQRVVAVDIFPPSWFGFDALKDFLGSRVEFVEATAYELPSLIGETFDVIIFWGVLYHLRHPLLALDSVRALLGGMCYLETAVCDGEVGEMRSVPLARFYRGDELHSDPSNWFAPTITGLLDWCASSGLDAEVRAAWPEEAPERCMLKVEPSPGDPEYRIVSYERQLKCAPTGPLVADDRS